MAYRRPPRLKTFDYRGAHRYLLTMCTFDRARRFVDAATVDSVRRQLLTVAEATAKLGEMGLVRHAERTADVVASGSVDVLALDDLGVEHQSDFGRSVLTEILLHRHEDGGRTVVTSNLDGEAFRRRIGQRERGRHLDVRRAERRRWRRRRLPGPGRLRAARPIRSTATPCTKNDVSSVAFVCLHVIVTSWRPGSSGV